MYCIEYKDSKNNVCIKEVKDLSEALTFATTLGIPVTINGDGIELVGTFGSAGIENGRLPNGDRYTWYKRRRP